MDLKSRISFVLKWTAPGNNYDYDTALDYQLRVFPDRVQASTNFDAAYVLTIDNFNIHGQMLEPVSAGTVQSVIVELKNLTNGTYYLALRTMNYAGEFSEVSNVIEISYKAPIFPLIKTTGNSFTDDIIPTTGSDLDEQPISNKSPLKLAIGLTCGILFLLFVIGLILFIYCTRLQRDRKEEEERRQRVLTHYGGAPTLSREDIQKTESSDALYQSTNTVNISVISPVNSWPANSLLSHYETLKRNKNSDSEGSTTQPKDSSDSASVTSSKYSYVHRVDQNSSLYDPIYFPTSDRDTMNYPFNPTYMPFNPTYTSSLRRHREDGMIDHGYSSNSISCYSYTPDGGGQSRLATDL